MPCDRRVLGIWQAGVSDVLEVAKGEMDVVCVSCVLSKNRLRPDCTRNRASLAGTEEQKCLAALSLSGEVSQVLREATTRRWKANRQHCATNTRLAEPVKMSQPSLYNAIVKRPWLRRWMEPLSKWYCETAGYRSLGLR